jgi:hypothetical protein
VAWGALSKAAVQEADDEVRARAVAALERNAHDAEILKTLQRVSERDSSDGVRQRARTALESAR